VSALCFSKLKNKVEPQRQQKTTTASAAISEAAAWGQLDDSVENKP
jgi:hypothetical protein